MNTVEFTLSPEQQDELSEIFHKAMEDIYRFCDAFVEAVEIILEAIREIATSLAQYFLKQQLLEWKIPYRIADFISRNTPWYWSRQIGFNWFERKFSLIE